MEKRGSERTTKRLEVEFSAGNITHSGITSNLSENSMFIRTKKGLAPGTALEIGLYLPTGEKLTFHGVVKRTKKTILHEVKNGMGIKLINVPRQYLDFVKSLK